MNVSLRVNPVLGVALVYPDGLVLPLLMGGCESSVLIDGRVRPGLSGVVVGGEVTRAPLVGDAGLEPKVLWKPCAYESGATDWAGVKNPGAGLDAARLCVGVLARTGAASKTAMSSVARPGGGSPGSVDARECIDGDAGKGKAERRTAVEEGREEASSVRSVILLRRVAGCCCGGGEPAKEGRETKEGEPV